MDDGCIIYVVVIINFAKKMMEVKEVDVWMHFKKLVMIFNCHYFNLIISKFKINDTFMFVNENEKKRLK